MGGSLYFVNVLDPPPEGFFFEAGGERISGRKYAEFEPRLRSLLSRHHIDGPPESVLARYMAAHIADPARYIRGPLSSVAPVRVRGPEALENSEPYFGRPVVPFDRIERRVATCSSCPRHYRGWCPTCNGHVSRMRAAFGGRRPSLPCDAATGVCLCTDAYEYAMCSVEYGKDEKVWAGAPETCWRYRDV